MSHSTIHELPQDGEAVTPCCGRTLFELPRGDRATREIGMVNCQTMEEADSWDTTNSPPTSACSSKDDTL